MKQQQFVDKHQATWDRYRKLLAQLESTKRRSNPVDAGDFPLLYRRICSHFALARQRRYSSSLVEQLHDGVLRGHAVLYKRKATWIWRAIAYLWVTIPTTIRRHAALFWLGSGLFWGPALVMGTLVYLHPDLIYSVASPGDVANFEWMYDPNNPVLGRGEHRAAATNFVMFGFYIWNNVGIGFRAFALGMLFGIGTAFILGFNGLLIGAVAGYLTQLGYIDTFWPFVATHSAFELTAICISGAAGLLLGRGLLQPERRTRVESLKFAAREAIPLVVGAMVMLFIAAFIEAYWSSNRALPLPLKFSVAGVMWLSVIAYLALAGRRHAA